MAPVESPWSPSLHFLVLPVLLTLMEGEMTRSEIARRSGLSAVKVNSILDELEAARLVVRTRVCVRDQYVEPCFAIADGDAALATIGVGMRDNPVQWLLRLLDMVRGEIPRVVQQGHRAQVWYSRLQLVPENARRLEQSLVRTLAEYETLQEQMQASESQGTSDEREGYRLVIALYRVDTDQSTDPQRGQRGSS
jgi:DNA-binding Lrp family transcriptional regulator